MIEIKYSGRAWELSGWFLICIALIGCGAFGVLRVIVYMNWVFVGGHFFWSLS